jgi:hypothetical protein
VEYALAMSHDLCDLSTSSPLNLINPYIRIDVNGAAVEIARGGGRSARRWSASRHQPAPMRRLLAPRNSGRSHPSDSQRVCARCSS